MKRLLFLSCLLACLVCFHGSVLAAEKTEKSAREIFQEEVAGTKKVMMENSIALDELNASTKTYRLLWMEAKAAGEIPAEAKELVKKIRELRTEFTENNESTEPYQEAKKACAQEKNAEGAIAAMENIIRIQEYRLEKKGEINALWKQVAGLVK